MKKVLIMSAVAAFFAACSNTPAVSESASKVESLKNWVDSIKTVAEGATTADSSQWAAWAADFNKAQETIKADELDEATKTILDGVNTAWEGLGTMYSAKINEAKEAAMKAMETTDSTAAKVEGSEQTLLEKATETAKEESNKVIDKTSAKMK
jgi:peroxiredoxin